MFIWHLATLLSLAVVAATMRENCSVIVAASGDLQCKILA